MTAGSATSQGLRALAFLLAARILGPVGFGQLNFLYATVNTLGMVAGLGSGLVVTRQLSEWRHSQPARAANLLALGTQISLLSAGVAAIVLWSAAGQLSERVFRDPGLMGEVQLAGGLVLLQAWLAAGAAALTGFEQFRWLAILQGLHGLLLVVGIWLGASLGGVSGALAGMAVGTGTAALAQHCYLVEVCRRSGIRIPWRESRLERGLIRRFWTPAWIGSTLNLPVNWLAAALLAWQPGGYGQLGVFAAANQWRGLLLFLPGVVERSSLPILSRLCGHGRWSEYLDASRLQRWVAGLPAVLAGAAVVVLAPWLMSWYGVGFASQWPVLVAMVVAGVFGALASPVGTGLISAGRLWTATSLSALWAAVLLVSAWQLAPRAGALGLATAYALAYGWLWAAASFVWRRHARSTGHSEEALARLRGPETASSLPAGVPEPAARVLGTRVNQDFPVGDRRG